MRLGCVLAGGAFIFTLVTEPSIGGMDWYVPLLAGIALFGLDMVLDTLLGRRRNVPEGHRFPSCMQNRFESEAECFACVTSFGEDNHLIAMPLLSRGRAEVNFGSLTLDLTGCQQFAEGCQLELHSNLGEMHVRSPASAGLKPISRLPLPPATPSAAPILRHQPKFM